MTDEQRSRATLYSHRSGTVENVTPVPPKESEPMLTEDLIRPILAQTYGDSDRTRALAVHLAKRIDSYDGYYDDRGGRKYMVMRACWDWMTGGTTAESVARKIEAALKDSVLDVEHAIDDVCRRCGGRGWDGSPLGPGGDCEPCNGTGRTYPLHNRTEAA